MAIQVYDMGLDFTKGEGTSISDFRLKQAQANQADATANKYRAENDAKQKAAALQARRGKHLKQSMGLKIGEEDASEEQKMVLFAELLASDEDAEGYAAASKSLEEHRAAQSKLAKEKGEIDKANSLKYAPVWDDFSKNGSDENYLSKIALYNKIDPPLGAKIQEYYDGFKHEPVEERQRLAKERVDPEYAKFVSIDTGDGTQRIRDNEGGFVPKVASAANLLTSEDKAKDREQRASQFIKGEAGKNTRAANTIANSGQGKGKLKYITDKTGTVSVLQDGEVVRRIPGIGKQSSDYQKKIITNEDMNRKIDVLIPELESIIEDDGLIDQSTGSGIGALWDLAAGFVGHATKGSIAISRLQPIWDKALKLIPRFEGPQSDKDVKTYQEAAADAANPYLPTERRKAAIGELVRLFKELKGQFTTQKVEDAGGRVEPQQKIRVKF